MKTDEKEYYCFTERFFNRWANFYDIFTLPIFGLRHGVVKFTKAKAGSTVLDVSTGTGKQAFAFAEKGYDVIGTDISKAMLDIANKHNKYKNVRFELADATHLPFNDNHFDVSCISFSLHDMPQTIREKVLREMMRVTKSEGMIVVVDYAQPVNRLRKLLMYHFVKLYESKWYIDFIHSDFRGLIKGLGIDIAAELSILCGCGIILTGSRQGLR